MSVVRISVGARDFFSPKSPDRLWSPLDVLFKGHGVIIPAPMQPSLEAGHLHLCNAVVKIKWSYISSPPICFVMCVEKLYLLHISELLAAHRGLG